MSDQPDITEQLEDLFEVGTRLLKQLERPQQAPVVNVEAARQVAPVVHVSTPPVVMPAPTVAISPQRPFRKLDFELIRDRTGEIQRIVCTIEEPG